MEWSLKRSLRPLGKTDPLSSAHTHTHLHAYTESAGVRASQPIFRGESAFFRGQYLLGFLQQVALDHPLNEAPCQRRHGLPALAKEIGCKGAGCL